MTFFELTNFLCEANSNEEIFTAYVTISNKSFAKEYSWESRTYIFTSEEKRFKADAISSSIWASSVDGTDANIKLSDYIYGPSCWEVESCGIVNFQLSKTVENNISKLLFFKTSISATNAMLEEFKNIAKEECKTFEKEFKETHSGKEPTIYDYIKDFPLDYDYGFEKDIAYALDNGEHIEWIVTKLFVSNNIVEKIWPNCTE